MKIIRDSAVYLVGELCSKITPFLLLPYLTRKLGADGFGELAYYQSIIALLLVFVGLSQDGAVARYIYRYGSKTLGAAILGGMVYSAAVTSILILIGVLANSVVIVAIAITAFFQSFLNVQLVVRQFQKRAALYSMLQVMSGALSISLTFSLFEIIGASAFTRVMANAMSLAVCSFIAFSLLCLKDEVRLLFSLRIYKKVILFVMSFGFPLIFHHLSFWVRGQFDRIILYESFPNDAVGFYSAGYQLSQVYLVLIMALNKAVVPYFFDNIKSGLIDECRLKKLFRFAFFPIAIPSLVAVAVPGNIYVLILGQGFEESKKYFVIFLLVHSLMIPYLVLANYIFYSGKTKYLSISNMISAAVYLFFVWLFVGYGIDWVPVASLISASTLLLVLYISSFHCGQARMNGA